MSTSEIPVRNRFRFGIRSLIILTTLTALLSYFFIPNHIAPQGERAYITSVYGDLMFRTELKSGIFAGSPKSPRSLALSSAAPPLSSKQAAESAMQHCKGLVELGLTVSDLEVRRCQLYKFVEDDHFYQYWVVKLTSPKKPMSDEINLIVLMNGKTVVPTIYRKNSLGDIELVEPDESTTKESK